MNKTELNRLSGESRRAIDEEVHLINEVYKSSLEVILHVQIAHCKREMECAARLAFLGLRTTLYTGRRV